MQPGDKVRFLNAVGGGVITRIDGRTAYVEDQDGFETPVLTSELVIVMPAGHDTKADKKGGANLMFDQRAFDTGRAANSPATASTPAAIPTTTPSIPVEETEYGDSINLVIAFEPTDLKHLSQSRFALLMVNDSNYYISYTLSARTDNKAPLHLVTAGLLEPNIEEELTRIDYKDLNDYAQILVQCIAYKQDKPYELKSPVSVLRKLDLSKFYKIHCFRPGKYFETEVIEIPIIEDDRASHPLQVDEAEIAQKLGANLMNKDAKPRKGKGNRNKPGDNPNRLLPPIEVDLHIHELVDTTAGMNNADMLQLQLKTVRDTMQAHRRRKGQKIIFIHGKGEGVLRKAVLDLLKKEYPAAELQDASFREYGFGATLVTVH